MRLEQYQEILQMWDSPDRDVRALTGSGGSTHGVASAKNLDNSALGEE